MKRPGAFVQGGRDRHAAPQDGGRGADRATQRPEVRPRCDEPLFFGWLTQWVTGLRTVLDLGCRKPGSAPTAGEMTTIFALQGHKERSAQTEVWAEQVRRAGSS